MTDEETLIAFVLKYRRKTRFYGHERWPTLRTCAREFRVPQEVIEEMAYVSDRLDLIVRFKIGDKYGGLPDYLWAVRVTDVPPIRHLQERQGPKKAPFT